MIYIYLAFHLYQITNISITADSQDVLYGVWNLEYLLYPLSKIVTLLWTSITTQVEADQWPCNAWNQQCCISSVAFRNAQQLHSKPCIAWRCGSGMSSTDYMGIQISCAASHGHYWNFSASIKSAKRLRMLCFIQRQGFVSHKSSRCGIEVRLCLSWVWRPNMGEIVGICNAVSQYPSPCDSFGCGCPPFESGIRRWADVWFWNA